MGAPVDARPARTSGAGSSPIVWYSRIVRTGSPAAGAELVDAPLEAVADVAVAGTFTTLDSNSKYRYGKYRE